MCNVKAPTELLVGKFSFIDIRLCDNICKDGILKTNSDNADTKEVCMSSEVSAIYLAMKNSKLECLDEYEQDSMMVDSSVEEEERYEEYDDFDPYFFIKNLPELSTVVPTFRRHLLPKQTRRCPPTTLVLDLDGMFCKDKSGGKRMHTHTHKHIASCATKLGWCSSDLVT